MNHHDVVIVGGGHGGAQAAIALRQGGFGGSIAIVGEEPDLPYERPPLSKEYLAGNRTLERMLIRPPVFWSDRDVTLLPGTRIVAVDPAGHRIETAIGARLGYGKLIWAAGGHARRLTCEGHAVGGVHTIRTRADVDKLIGELPTVATAVVIGGGFIGLEAAAVLVNLGVRVVLLEAMDRVMARVAAPELSRFYEREHRAHGVDVRLNSRVDSILGDDMVTGVRLSDGTVLPAQLVVVGIGIVPAVEPLLAAGAAGGDGVRVDEQCLTSLPDIYAIGDCALHANRFAGGRMVRVESVQNATDQAGVAANAVRGLPASYGAVPWFWSNQYDMKLQTVGLSIGHDEVVTRGDPYTRSFSLVYLKHGRVVALDCVNAVRDYVQGRKLVEAGASIERAALADVSRPLKAMLVNTETSNAIR